MPACPRCGAVVPSETGRCPACAARTEQDRDVGALYQPSAALIYDQGRAAPDAATAVPYGAPRTAARIVGYAFRLWAECLGRLVLLSLIPYAVLIPLGGAAVFLAIEAADDGDFLLPAIGVSSAALLAMAPLFLAAAAATLLALADQARHGRQERTIGELFGRGLRYVGRLIAIGVLVWLTVSGLATLPLIGWLVAWPLGLALALVALAAAVYLWVRWSAALPAAVVEDAPGLSGFGRSGRLVRGAWWRICGALVLYVLVLAGIQLVTGVLQLVPVAGLVVWVVVGLLNNSLGLAVNFAIYAALRDRELAGGG